MSAPTLSWQPAATSPPSGADCRVYERRACELPTTCQPIAARSDRDIVWPAVIRDVSEGGVGVVLGRRFERGAGLAIELPATNDRPAETLLAKVMHTTALPGNKWLLGCAFISRLSDDEVRLVVALAAALNPPPATEQASPATAVESTGEANTQIIRPAQEPGKSRLITDLWFEGTTHDGKAVRVPVRRLFLTGAWPLAVGTTLRLWVSDKSTHPDGTAVKVVKCRCEADGWTVTYRPIEPLSVETLRCLGFAG